MQQGPPSQAPPWQGPPTGPPWTWPGSIRRGMQWRVSVTILLITIWLVFIVIYAFIWSNAYNLFQDIVLFIASLIALFGGIAALWAGWGMRMAGVNWEHWR